MCLFMYYRSLKSERHKYINKMQIAYAQIFKKQSIQWSIRRRRELHFFLDINLVCNSIMKKVIACNCK